MFIMRHDAVLEALAAVVRCTGVCLTTNRNDPSSGLRPDLVIENRRPRLIIDVSVPHDDPSNLQSAYDAKIKKYERLGLVLPFVVGSLGSWLPTNNEIAKELKIGPRIWTALRRKVRVLAIKGSTAVIRHHFDPSVGNNRDGPSSPPTP